MHRIFSPIAYLLYAIPKIVFLPIVLLFFGATDLSKVLMIVLILFFQILVPVRDDAASIRPEVLYSVKSLGAGRRAAGGPRPFPARAGDAPVVSRARGGGGQARP